MRGWNRRRAAYLVRCDSPRSRVLSLNVRFYTESSLIRLLSVSAGFLRFQSQPSFLFIIFSSTKSAYFRLSTDRTFFREKKMRKKSLPGEIPPKPPLTCAPRKQPRNPRADSFVIFLKWSHCRHTHGYQLKMSKLLRNGCYSTACMLFKERCVRLRVSFS